jgi:hypothetical protein
MSVTFVVKTRLESGTQVIQLRTGGAPLRLGGVTFTEPVWVVTDEIIKMLRRDNPKVEFVEETDAGRQD